MNTWKQIRSVAWAASIVVWGGAGISDASGQADAWITSSAPSGGTGNWTDMVNPVIVSPALPSPGTPLGYSGSTPQFSHHVRTNGSGSLDFFVVDGMLYDGDGYLIADARMDDCTECLGRGVLEFMSVPVPGYCGLFFLFASEAKTLAYSGSHVQVALLDMERPNPRFPQTDQCVARKGALVNLFNEDLEESYPSLGGWLWGEDYFLEPMPNTSDYVALLPNDNVGKSQSPMLRVVAGVGPGAPTFLFAVMTTRMYIYRISASGIEPVSPVGGLAHMPLYSTNDVFTTKQYYRDVDVRRTPQGDIQLFMTGGPGLNAYPFDDPIEPVYNMLAMRFNAQTGALIAGSVQGFAIDFTPLGCNSTPGGGSVGGAAGCALDPSADGAWVLSEVTEDCVSWQPKLTHLDLASGSVTDLSAQVSGLGAFVRSRMYRNDHASWINERVYIPHAGGIASFENTDTPANLVFQANTFPGAFPPVHAGTPGSPSTSYQPRFLAPAVERDGHLSSNNIEQCCVYFETVPGAVVEGYTQAAGTTSTWNGIQNGLQTSSNAAVFMCDLVVETGASLFISNMDLKFANNAKVVVRRGGYLKFNNCSLSSLECPDQRWPGIRVEGDPLNSSQSSGVQGIVHLNSTVVSNAVVGVWCARELNPTTPVAGFFGGRLIASQSTFSNCITGVRITNYHRYSGGMELPNLSLISQTNFETTSSSPDGATPGKHIELLDVNGVTISNSRFRNLDPEQYPVADRGIGVFAYDASFRCLGNSNYTTNRFENLYVGVVASVPDPAEVYTVDGMGFFNNLHGVFDLGSTGGVVTNNRFITLASNTPVTSSSVGLSLFNAEGYTVERNTFTDQGTSVPSVGIHFLGQSLQNNEVYDNEFNDLNLGCLVQGRHVAINANPSLAPGLQMRCGDHLGNLADQLIQYDGWIRHNQGLGENTQKLANNRFLSDVTCSPGNPNAPSVNTYVAALQPTGFYVNYHYYDHVESPEQRQECIEDEFGNPLSFTGETFYDLNGHLRPDPFDKAEHCASGKLDLSELLNGLNLEGTYYERQAELNSAWQNYLGAMDRMKTGDLVGMIEHKPWHPSHAVRDTLLGNHPLTDSVMTVMLKRDQALDAWHLTQVLIQNSPLSPWVWRTIDDSNALPTYFNNILKQYDQGMGLKQVLEQEIVARQQEVQESKVLLLDSLANDTTVSHRYQVLTGLLEADQHGDGLRGRYLLALLNGDHATATSLETEVQQVRGSDGLLAWGQRYMAVNGDWAQSSTADRVLLHQMAMDHAPSGGALAWATLYQLDELDSLPTPELPLMFKSLPRWQNTEEELSGTPIIAVLPNPATDRIAFTYGEGLEEGTLEVFDAQGRSVLTIALSGQKGLKESSVLGWSPGLYVVRLMLDGHNLGSTKFNVVR